MTNLLQRLDKEYRLLMGSAVVLILAPIWGRDGAAELSGRP